MSQQKPNVILVLTDDQGYGDLGCTGNPRVKTPNIDNFYEDSVHCQDFHVSPLCTPTRGALMTGHNPLRNGAWATCWGRSILKEDEITMADIFNENGYKTAMFGKWHLGDNYPYRPQDRGFQKVIAHKGGGVGQTPDFWGNNYFDDTYFSNGNCEEYSGYCTDIWFEEALNFIKENKNQPFFCYIATNAPHSPYLVPYKYKNMYEDVENIPYPAFYGMISNIDENFGKLDNYLEKNNLKDNTILIFMTDNGSSGGCTLNEDGYVNNGYNARMRGKKGSYYEGGHRVPFFIRWPNGDIKGNYDINELITHMDLLPSLIDLCNLKNIHNIQFDGENITPLLKKEKHQLKERNIFVQYRQNTNPPLKWENAVLSDRWRLIKGKELYDIKSDPEQKNNIAEKNQEVVQKLRQAQEQWWDSISPNLEKRCPIHLGNEKENPTCLTSMDVMGDVAWNQCHIARAKKSTGKWCVKIVKKGKYKFSLRRWPEELNIAIDAGISPEELEEIAPYEIEKESNKTNPQKAQIKIFNKARSIDINPQDKKVTFKLEIFKKGVTELEAWFLKENICQGAYYVYVEKI